MGIPRFYRWLSERYPNINEAISIDQIPEFDNLYLDMNGIVHNCSHNNMGGLAVKEEDEIFIETFTYISRLFQIIRPQKLVYMAVDGCAPRAKMNQQRSRRFRAANDAREAIDLALEMGEDLPEKPFDSNCITPGTEFMARLTEHLHFFICKKIQEDPLWQGIEVILSGPETPGEGEHKIMDYIRKAKSQPEHDPNTRHCLYGLDADLIMLALASHEPHFALLREEVVFGKQLAEQVENRAMEKQEKFQLLHIALLREYLELEFGGDRAQLQFEFSLERLIDDFILFCILVGNDFLPNLPLFEIGDQGLDDLFECYKRHLRAACTEAWLTGSCGEICWPQLEQFLRRHAEVETVKLEAAVKDSVFELGKRRTVGPRDVPSPPLPRPNEVLEFMPTVQDARRQYYDIKFEFDIRTAEGVSEQQSVFKSYLEGLQWVMFYYYRGPEGSSWSWYYPYYHAPMIADLVTYARVADPGIIFHVDKPFSPFQQLMAVYPEASKGLLPECFQWLFHDEASPILDFYPQKFQIDVDGVKVPWGGVTMIPFIDSSRLLDAMSLAMKRGPALTEAEQKRNSFSKPQVFRFCQEQRATIDSSMPLRFQDLACCPVAMEAFEHSLLPQHLQCFVNDLLPGAAPLAKGFPTLRLHPVTVTYETGVKVFLRESQKRSLIVTLHPEAPMVPSETDIQELLALPLVQVDYPFLHQGRIKAVHTALQKYSAHGRVRKNNAGQHEALVRQLAQDARRRGVVLRFEGENWLHQPVVEIEPLELSYLDVEGRTVHRFQSSSEWRLLHLVHWEEPKPAKPQLSLSERFPLGTPVLCVDPEDACFGQLGLVEENVAGVEASFEPRLSQDEQAQLQRNLHSLVQQRQMQLRWWQLCEFAQQVKLEMRVLRQLLGVVFFRGPEKVREEVGMALMCDTRKDKLPLCVPSYSRRLSSGWMFSDLAVAAVQDYKERFPGVVEALRNRHDAWKDLEARECFQDSRSLEWSCKQLLKYIGGQPYKKLHLAPAHHQAVAPEAVLAAAELLDRAFLTANGVGSCRVYGEQRLCRGLHSGSQLSLAIFDGKPLQLGQRCVYTAARGAVPCGTRGVVIGIFGAQSPEVELLLEEQNLGATALHGRTPASRGLRVPMAAVMPLRPLLCEDTKRRTRCRYGVDCYDFGRSHRSRYSHPRDDDWRQCSQGRVGVAAAGSAVVAAAKRQARGCDHDCHDGCTMHGSKYSHLCDNDLNELPSEAPQVLVVRPKCSFGAKCYRTSPEHRSEFAHPDDPDWSSAASMKPAEPTGTPLMPPLPMLPPPLPPPLSSPGSLPSDVSCKVKCAWLQQLDLRLLEQLEGDLWTLAKNFSLSEARLDRACISLVAPDAESLSAARAELVDGILEFYKPQTVRPTSHAPSFSPTPQEVRVDGSAGSEWTWAEFRRRYEAEFGLSETTKYWNTMACSGHLPPGLQKVAPSDGSLWTRSEFKARFDTSCEVKCAWIQQLDLSLLELLEGDLWTLAKNFGLSEASLDRACISLVAPDAESLSAARAELVDGILEFYKPQTARPTSHAPSFSPTPQEVRVDGSAGSEWTWAEFRRRYEAEFGLSETTKYWNTMACSGHLRQGLQKVAASEAENGLQATASYWDGMPVDPASLSGQYLNRSSKLSRGGA